MSKTYLKIPCLCGSLRRVERMLTRYYDDCLRPSSMTGVQFSLLALIARQPGQSQQKLAEQLEMDKATLSRNLKGMLEAGWVEAESGEDRRVRTWRLTPLGRKKQTEATPLWEQAQRELQRQLGGDFNNFLNLFNALPERIQTKS